MKNKFILGLLVGMAGTILLGFTAMQSTTIFQPAAPVVVSAKFCTTPVQIIAAIKFYADRNYLVDVTQLSTGDVIIVGKKY